MPPFTGGMFVTLFDSGYKTRILLYMSFLVYFFVFMFGAIIGSFLNVVILRFNTGVGKQGRSHCLSCAVSLAWYDLVPVASFFVLGRRCRSCRGLISSQYPIVEISTAVLFLLTYLSIIVRVEGFAGHPVLFAFSSIPALAWFNLLFFFAVWCLLMVIVVYDIRHTIIPDVFVYALAMLALVRLALFAFIQHTTGSALLSFVLSGPLLALPFFLIWYFSRGRAMGFGDVKLALPIGWIFGISQSITIFVLSFWIGAIVGIGLLVRSMMYAYLHKRKKHLSRGSARVTMKSEVPFAPFLILAMVLVFFFHLDFSAISMFLYQL